MNIKDSEDPGKRVRSKKEIYILWLDLPQDWLVLNIDGAYKGTPWIDGGGGIIKDNRGVFQRAFAENFGICTAYKAEFRRPQLV